MRKKTQNYFSVQIFLEILQTNDNLIAFDLSNFINFLIEHSYNEVTLFY